MTFSGHGRCVVLRCTTVRSALCAVSNVDTMATNVCSLFHASYCVVYLYYFTTYIAAKDVVITRAFKMYRNGLSFVNREKCTLLIALQQTCSLVCKFTFHYFNPSSEALVDGA